MKTTVRLTTDGSAVRQAAPAGLPWDAKVAALLASLVFPALVSLLFVVVYWNRMLSADVAVYVLAMRDWLGGAVLYRDVVDINPPLNFYLTLPAILLSNALDLSPENGAYIAFAVLVFASLHWCFRILHVEQGMSLRAASGMTLAIGVALLAPSSSQQIQRDGLVLVFMMPWLLSQMGPRPNAPGIWRTVFFGIGVCLKHYYIVFPLFMTVYQVVAQRSLRPILSVSNLTLLVVGLTYASHVALTHPEYFSQVVPLALEFYGSIHPDRGVLVLRLIVPGALAVAMLSMLALRVRDLPKGTGVLVTAMLAGLVSYLWQDKGFRYHLYPFVCFAFLVAFWVLIRGKDLAAQKAACALVVLVLAVSTVRTGFYRDSGIDELLAMTDGLPAQSIWVLSTDPAVGPGAALAAQRRWAVRYPHNWVAPGLVNGRAETDCAAAPAACARFDEVQRGNASDYAADLLTKRPEIAVVDKAAFFITDRSFDWYAYMSAAPEFAEVMAGYRLHSSSGRFDVYLRKD